MSQEVGYFFERTATREQATRGELTLKTNSGAIHSQFVENPLGHATNPMSETDLIAKFTQCAGYAKGSTQAARANAAIKSILRLESIEELHREFFLSKIINDVTAEGDFQVTNYME